MEAWPGPVAGGGGPEPKTPRKGTGERISPMATQAQGNADRSLEAVLRAAMEAAAGRVGQRASAVVMAARLATAVHMRRSAPADTAASPRALGPDTSEAAPAEQADAASVMREGEAA